MLAELYAGETARVATKVKDATGAVITAGAVVTVVILNPDETQLDSLTATIDGSEWVVLRTMPTVAGLYPVETTAEYNGATGKDKDYIRVKGF